MIRVLFVCLGNICRSTMAEAVFAHKVREAGLKEQIEADSAGTGDWHVGKPPYAGTRKILAKNNIEYAHSGRQISARDLDDFDYVIPMDEANLGDIRAIGHGCAKIALFLDYAPNASVREVPDPYYTGNFEEVYLLCIDAVEGLLTAIRREHGL